MDHQLRLTRLDHTPMALCRQDNILFRAILSHLTVPARLGLTITTLGDRHRRTPMRLIVPA